MTCNINLVLIKKNMYGVDLATEKLVSGIKKTEKL